MQFIQRLRMGGLLSFPPDSETYGGWVSLGPTRERYRHLS